MEEKSIENIIIERLKGYNYYKDIQENKNLYNIIHAYETLKYYINFHRENEELTEQLAEIVAELQAEDY